MIKAFDISSLASSSVRTRLLRPMIQNMHHSFTIGTTFSIATSSQKLRSFL